MKLTGITESKFPKRGYQQSGNTTGGRCDSKPLREQLGLGVRPLRKLELTGTMGIKIRHLHLIAVRQMVMREQSNPSPDDN